MRLNPSCLLGRLGIVESIAAAMNCRDAPGVFGVVAQGLPYVEDARFEHCILYKSSRPDSAE
jgi:hypothetical protein